MPRTRIPGTHQLSTDGGFAMLEPSAQEEAETRAVLTACRAELEDFYSAATNLAKVQSTGTQYGTSEPLRQAIRQADAALTAARSLYLAALENARAGR